MEPSVITGWVVTEPCIQSDCTVLREALGIEHGKEPRGLLTSSFQRPGQVSIKSRIFPNSGHKRPVLVSPSSPH